MNDLTKGEEEDEPWHYFEKGNLRNHHAGKRKRETQK